MYQPNPERNKIVYELWEKGLTVEGIASVTGIPRSTVGYYVRKFNRLAAEGKPVVFPKDHKVVPVRKASFFSDILQTTKETAARLNRAKVREMLVAGRYQELYYYLKVLKLIKHLDSIVTPETFDEVVKP